MLENILTKSSQDTEKEAKLVMFLASQAFDFYFGTFPHGDGPTEDTKEYGQVKKATKERFSPKKPQTIVMREAVSLRYHGVIQKSSLRKQTIYRRDASLNGESKLGLLRETFEEVQCFSSPY